MHENERFQPGSQIDINMPNGYRITGTLLVWMSAGFLIETDTKTTFVPYTTMWTASVSKEESLAAPSELATTGVG